MQALPTSRGVPQNAACGVAHRRTRNCPSPHAEIAIAARGVWNAPEQGFSTPLSPHSFCKFFSPTSKQK